MNRDNPYSRKVELGAAVSFALIESECLFGGGINSISGAPGGTKENRSPATVLIFFSHEGVRMQKLFTKSRDAKAEMSNYVVHSQINK